MKGRLTKLGSSTKRQRTSMNYNVELSEFISNNIVKIISNQPLAEVHSMHLMTALSKNTLIL